MRNKPQVVSSAGVQPVSNQKEIIFSGQIGSFVAHADTQQTNYFFGGGSLPSSTDTPDLGAPPQMDFRFYNLFVISSEYINGQTFSLPKELALQDTDGDVVEALNILDTREINAIRCFPTIVVEKNKSCGSIGEGQTARYGFLNGIVVQADNIQFSFVKLQDIPQPLLLSHAGDLGIGKASAYNEFDRPHWAVKKINIVDTLKSYDIKVLVLG